MSREHNSQVYSSHIMRIKTRRHKDRLNNDPERGLLFTNSQNNTLKCFIEHKRIKFYNTPGLSRGKAAGKIRNMAEENIEEVFLTPDVIPGAAVKHEEIGKLTVNQLKFWLKCRRIN